MSDETSDPATRVARLVLHDALRVRAGENVTIEAWSESLPWVKPFVTEARRMGARPMTLYEDESAFWEAATSGKLGSLGTVGDHEWAALAKTNAYVFFYGPSEWTRMDDLPERVADRAMAYNTEWYRRASRAKLRGVRMYLGRTSQRAADRFGVNLESWRQELVRATLVPPASMARTGRKIARMLERGNRLEVSQADGTRVQLRLRHYRAQLDDGIIDAADIKAGNNLTWMPSGVVGVAVDDSQVDGTVVANRTVYLPAGPADGGRWTFRDGRLQSHTYDRGSEHFEKPYAEASKGRDQLGFLSIGLNPEISMSPMMEDQEAGALTLRVGGNRFFGGKNRSDFGSWLTVRGADITIDGKPVVSGGRLA